MKKKLSLCSLVFIASSLWLQAQETSKTWEEANKFPEFTQRHIPGAPELGMPQLIMGEAKPVMGEGMGWAAPATYDVNKDGKKDLLIGEFCSGLENREAGGVTGHYIWVYLNIGTDDHPKFNDEYTYLRPISGTNNGAVLSINVFCCQSFRPQFADLDNDGAMDLLSGQYFPGDIMWYRGVKHYKGFMPGVPLVQEGRDKHPEFMTGDSFACA